MSREGGIITVTDPIFGDGGKGKVVDFLACLEGVMAVVRLQGGNNAGHIVVVGRQEYKFHYIPVGILAAQVVPIWCVMGRGMVVNLSALFAEIDHHQESGLAIDPSKLLISEGAHLTLPYHLALELARESGTGKKDTTRKAISPTYGFIRFYQGVRAGDVRDIDRVSNLIETPLSWANAILEGVYGAPRVSRDEVMAEVELHRKRLLPYLGNEIQLLNNLLKQGDVICEGAQGGMLDVDLGIYPYTTASNTWPAAIQHGCGLDPRRITRQIYVVKAYLTRVGQGPLVSEIPETDWRGEHIRQIGKEYGTTTGRPRRIGWPDQVIGRFAATISPPTEIVITKADVLSNLPLAICKDYLINGKIIRFFPTTMEELEKCQPRLVDYPGWNSPINRMRHLADLPEECSDYLRAVAAPYGAQITMVGVGPERSEMIIV